MWYLLGEREGGVFECWRAGALGLIYGIKYKATM